jgi:hypothetical protein
MTVVLIVDNHLTSCLRLFLWLRPFPWLFNDCILVVLRPFPWLFNDRFFGCFTTVSLVIYDRCLDCFVACLNSFVCLFKNRFFYCLTTGGPCSLTTVSLLFQARRHAAQEEEAQREAVTTPWQSMFIIEGTSDSLNGWHYYGNPGSSNMWFMGTLAVALWLLLWEP